MVAGELGRAAVFQDDCVDDVAAETGHAPPPSCWSALCLATWVNNVLKPHTFADAMVVVVQRSERSVVARVMSVRLRSITPNAEGWQSSVDCGFLENSQGFDEPSWVRIPDPPPSSIADPCVAPRPASGSHKSRHPGSIPGHATSPRVN